MKTIRITVVGDGDTGKTCMLIVYKDKQFNDSYIPTVFDAYSMTIPINYEDYMVVLFDTAGQEEYDKLRKLAYRDANVFILCYAVNTYDSFENVVQKWAPELKVCNAKAKIILAGTKIDLRDSDSITTEQGQKMARVIHAAGFIENSSKSRQNIDETFAMAINIAVKSKTSNPPKKKSTQCTLL